jgi:site-specific recombinase XerD
MMDKSFGLLFYLKKPKKYVGGPVPIYLRITVNGVPKELSTKRECDPQRWNPYAQCAKGTNEDSRALNYYLDTLRRQVYEARRRLIDEKTVITAYGIKNILVGSVDAPKMILQIFQEHNDQLKELVGKDFSPATLERYKTSLEHTRSFILWKYKVEDMDIAKLDYEFVTEYEFWLKSKRHCNHNTSIKYISNFRKIVNRCIRNGWLPRDPFAGFKMTKKEVERSALTQEEIQGIINKKFATPRLEQVRDIFIFACFTGLAYADIKKLRQSEVVVGVDGGEWIFTNRQKTDSSSRIPLLPIPLGIIEKYKEHPLCDNKGLLLPVLSNQKMNAYLKEIADVCDINKNLTFHLARHTFATTVTLTNGVPIESVSKMLGHKNIRTTQLYAKVLDMKVSDDMKRLKERLQK